MQQPDNIRRAFVEGGRHVRVGAQRARRVLEKLWSKHVQPRQEPYRSGSRAGFFVLVQAQLVKHLLITFDHTSPRDKMTLSIRRNECLSRALKTLGHDGSSREARDLLRYIVEKSYQGARICTTPPPSIANVCTPNEPGQAEGRGCIPRDHHHHQLLAHEGLVRKVVDDSVRRSDSEYGKSTTLSYLERVQDVIGDDMAGELFDARIDRGVNAYDIFMEQQSIRLSRFFSRASVEVLVDVLNVKSESGLSELRQTVPVAWILSSDGGREANFLYMSSLDSAPEITRRWWTVVTLCRDPSKSLGVHANAACDAVAMALGTYCHDKRAVAPVEAVASVDAALAVRFGISPSESVIQTMADTIDGRNELFAWPYLLVDKDVQDASLPDRDLVSEAMGLKASLRESGMIVEIAGTDARSFVHTASTAMVRVSSGAESKRMDTLLRAFPGRLIPIAWMRDATALSDRAEETKSSAARYINPYGAVVASASVRLLCRRSVNDESVAVSCALNVLPLARPPGVTDASWRRIVSRSISAAPSGGSFWVAVEVPSSCTGQITRALEKVFNQMAGSNNKSIAYETGRVAILDELDDGFAADLDVSTLNTDLDTLCTSLFESHSDENLGFEIVPNAENDVSRHVKRFAAAHTDLLRAIVQLRLAVSDASDACDAYMWFMGVATGVGLETRNSQGRASAYPTLSTQIDEARGLEHRFSLGTSSLEQRGFVTRDRRMPLFLWRGDGTMLIDVVSYRAGGMAVSSSLTAIPRHFGRTRSADPAIRFMIG